MKRRAFLTAVGGAAAWPLVAAGQQPSMPVIGYLGVWSPEFDASRLAGLRHGLNETGYVEGRNFTVEYRWVRNQPDRLPALVAELIQIPVALIVTVGPPSTLAAKAATNTIPILFGVGADPVRIGLVASLNRPGGNVTGLLAMSLRAWISVLARPPRSPLPGSFLRRHSLWLAIAVVVMGPSMVLLDQRTISAVARLPEWVALAFKWLTDFGRSSWFLLPLGFCILALALSSPFMDRIGRRVSAIVTMRLSFLFAAIALPDIFVTVAKHLIGRRRPSSLGPFVYDPFSWSPAFASLPSAHAATACSVAVAFGALFPQIRFLLWTYALLIMASRIVISAHYPSDVMAGAFVGVFGALFVRNWFAERRLGLYVESGGRVRAHPGPSFARLRRINISGESRTIFDRR